MNNLYLVAAIHVGKFLVSLHRHPYLTAVVLAVILVILWNRFVSRTLRLCPPAKLSDMDLTGVFVAEMQASAEVSKQRLYAEGVAHQTRGSSALTAPTSAFSETLSSLPSVKGIDVGKFLGSILKILGFVFWRLETAVSAPAEKTVIAYGSLRWGWWTFYNWRVQGKDTAEVARKMASLILGVAYQPDPVVKWLQRRFRLRFSVRRFASTESFMLFAEGLHHLHLYQEQRKIQCLDEAEDRLHECISLAPSDLLPRYYLGIVRIEQAVLLRQSRDAMLSRKRILDEAISQLEVVASDLDKDGFHGSAQYNIACAHLYLISAQGYESARSILNELEPKLVIRESWLDRLTGAANRRKSATNEPSRIQTLRALQLQIESLLLLTYARPLWDGIIASDSISKVSERVRLFGSRVEECFQTGRISRCARNNLRSDYFYLLGHLERGHARSYADQVEKEENAAQVAAGKPSQNTDSEVVQSARKQEKVHLEKAVEYFEKALVYQPAWVPVLVNLKQVYQQLGRNADLCRISTQLPEWHPREELDAAVQPKAPQQSAPNRETHKDKDEVLKVSKAEDVTGASAHTVGGAVQSASGVAA